jgi:hypothetical protein
MAGLGTGCDTTPRRAVQFAQLEGTWRITELRAGGASYTTQLENRYDGFPTLTLTDSTQRRYELAGRRTDGSDLQASGRVQLTTADILTLVGGFRSPVSLGIAEMPVRSRVTLASVPQGRGDLLLEALLPNVTLGQPRLELRLELQ